MKPHAPVTNIPGEDIVAIFYPFSQFCEIDISLLSLQTQPNTAPNLFQRGVEYGKYGGHRQGGAVHGGGRGGTSAVHPVSITRFPLRRLSPGAGLLRFVLVSLVVAKIFQGLGPKRRESSKGDRLYA